MGCGITLWSSGFNPGVIHVRFVVKKMTLEQVFFMKIPVSPSRFYFTVALYSTVASGGTVGPLRAQVAAL
jgi:hypothetical protein